MLSQITIFYLILFYVTHFCSPRINCFLNIQTNYILYIYLCLLFTACFLKPNSEIYFYLKCTVKFYIYIEYF